MPGDSQSTWALKSGLRFVLLFGAVNLFADMTYEGARSVTGPFLAVLGASGLVVGTVTGFGEFLGYALRLLSGRWADRSHLYWPITILGYIVQMAAVPMLALVGSWPAAAVLILLERIGRATRNPPRNVMLAKAGEGMGLGWAFEINEALDQTGALVGPLAVAAIFASQQNYQIAFAALAFPAAITLLLVFGARVGFPAAGQLDARAAETLSTARYPTAYWVYLIGTGLVGFGFADFSLIAFHLSRAQVVPQIWIPIFYAFATVVVAAYAPLAFFGNFAAVLIGALLWGIGLGAHESVMQAVVARIVARERLASAYGVFGAGFGIACSPEA